MEKSPKPQAPILCIQALWNFDGTTLDQKKKKYLGKIREGKKHDQNILYEFFYK